MSSKQEIYYDVILKKDKKLVKEAIEKDIACGELNTAAVSERIRGQAVAAMLLMYVGDSVMINHLHDYMHQYTATYNSCEEETRVNQLNNLLKSVTDYCDRAIFEELEQDGEEDQDTTFNILPGPHGHNVPDSLTPIRKLASLVGMDIDFFSVTDYLSKIIRTERTYFLMGQADYLDAVGMHHEASRMLSIAKDLDKMHKEYDEKKAYDFDAWRRIFKVSNFGRRQDDILDNYLYGAELRTKEALLEWSSELDRLYYEENKKNKGY